jgi:hypothetical protein
MWIVQKIKETNLMDGAQLVMSNDPINMDRIITFTVGEFPGVGLSKMDTAAITPVSTTVKMEPITDSTLFGEGMPAVVFVAGMKHDKVEYLYWVFDKESDAVDAYDDIVKAVSK